MRLLPRSSQYRTLDCSAHLSIARRALGVSTQPSLPTAVVKTLHYAFAFLLAAERTFIWADNFFLAAALIGGRALVFLGADLPFHFAHRCFIASEIRLRAAALIVRRFWRVAGAVCDFGGRPRRGADGPTSPSSAEMA